MQDASPHVLITLLEAMQVDPPGIVSASLGAVISVLYVNANGFNYRRVMGTIMAAACLGGWSITLIENWGATGPAAHIINWMAGYLASDILSSIKSQAPTITNAVVTFFAARVGKFLTRVFGKTDENPKP
jgi:hypothetical protein